MIFCFLVLVVVVVNVAVLAQESGSDNRLSDAQFEALIENLNEQQPDSVRLQSLISLLDHADDPRVLESLKAIKAGLKDDNEDIRLKSAMAMTFALARQGRQCPIELLELIDDNSEKIQTNLIYLIDSFEKYPPEAFDVALRIYNEAGEDQKSGYLVLVAKTGKKDKRSLKILMDAVNSDFVARRINGTVGLWHATKNFELVLPLHFERIDDFFSYRSGENRFKDEYAGALISLTAGGTGHYFLSQLKQHPGPFVGALTQFGSSPNGRLRLQCATFVSTCLDLILASVVDTETVQRSPDLNFLKWVPAEFFQSVEDDSGKETRRQRLIEIMESNLRPVMELGKKFETDPRQDVVDLGKRITKTCREIEKITDPIRVSN